MSIDKYFEIIDDCIQYEDGDRQPYTASKIINNAYNMVLAMDLYTKPIKMWHKKTAYGKTGCIQDFVLQKSIIIFTNCNA